METSDYTNYTLCAQLVPEINNKPHNLKIKSLDNSNVLCNFKKGNQSCNYRPLKIRNYILKLIELIIVSVNFIVIRPEIKKN